MPDAQGGYGFPIGGVAAFDPAEGGVVSAGGVGFDISCGVRTLHTGLTRDEVMPVQKALADVLFRRIPAGLGSTVQVHLLRREMDRMLIEHVPGFQPATAGLPNAADEAGEIQSARSQQIEAQVRGSFVFGLSAMLYGECTIQGG